MRDLKYNTDLLIEYLGWGFSKYEIEINFRLLGINFQLINAYTDNIQYNPKKEYLLDIISSCCISPFNSENKCLTCGRQASDLEGNFRNVNLDLYWTDFESNDSLNRIEDYTLKAIKDHSDFESLLSVNIQKPYKVPVCNEENLYVFFQI